MAAIDLAVQTIVDQAPNEAIKHGDKTLTYNTRQAGFTVNQSKLSKNLKKDASIQDYEIITNNFDENVNIKCSSGFYNEVARPAILSLAKQASVSPSPVIMNDVQIQCRTNRVSFDDHDLLVNSTFCFDLLNIVGMSIGIVSIHCHNTTRLVQLQGSKLINGIKAPVWLLKAVLDKTFSQEASKRRSNILETNEAIINLTSDYLDCDMCDKKYKTKLNLEKHLKAKHGTQNIQEVSSNRKRRALNLDTEYDPPLKTAAVGSPTPRALSRPQSVIPPATPSVPPTCPRSLLNRNALSFQPALAVLSTSPLNCPLSDSAVVTASITTPGTDSHLAVSFKPVSTVPATSPLNYPRSSVPSITQVSSSTFSPLSDPAIVTASISTIGTDSHLAPLAPEPPPSDPCMVQAPTRSSTTQLGGTTLVTSTSSTFSTPSTTLTTPAPTTRTAAPEIITKATKGKNQKSKQTLATDPVEFAKENMKVERDFARLKVNQLEVKLRDHDETIKILTARCKLLENECKDYASKTSSSSQSQGAPVQPPPSSTCPPILGTGTSGSLETLVHLEVLKSIRGFSNNYKVDHTDNADIRHIASVFAQVNNITEKLETVLENENILNEKLNSISSFLNSSALSFSISSVEATKVSSASSQTDPVEPQVVPQPTDQPSQKYTTAPQVLKPTSQLHTPPPRKSILGYPPLARKSLLGPPPPALRTAGKPRKSLLGSPPLARTSLLGPPPPALRIVGKPFPLGTQFLKEHRVIGPRRNSQKSRKHMNPLHKPESSAEKSTIKRSVLPPEHSDDIPADTDTVEDLNVTETVQPLDDTIASLDNDFLTDMFGDPVNDCAVDPNAADLITLDLITLN